MAAYPLPDSEGLEGSGSLRDILLSSAVCVLCLIVAVVSQVISPSTVSAASGPSTLQAQVRNMEPPAVSSGPMELDPEVSNPRLFAMAFDANLADASGLGGPIEADAPQITTSGLMITDLKLGNGAVATAGQTVSVNYRGTLENGKEFDSSYGRGPFSFPLGAGRVIKGWDEGVAGMKVGGKRKLVVPPELGYGSRGAGGVIPPNATLIFEVELLEIKN